MVRPHLLELGLLLATPLLRSRRLHPAARIELAAPAEAREVRNVSFDHTEPSPRPNVVHRGDGPKEPVGVGVLRLIGAVEDFLRPAVHHPPPPPPPPPPP